MKHSNWIRNANMVKVWAESQEDCDQLQAINLSLTLGDMAGTDELRSTYWTAIRSIGSTMANFPKARKGRESGLTDSQDLVLQTVIAKLTNAFAQIGSDSQTDILTYLVPHGRTGGVYETFEEYVNQQVKSAKAYIAKSMKENRVEMDSEGEFVLDANDNLVITPTPTKGDSVEGSTEEE